jgi:hypothetical protein
MCNQEEEILNDPVANVSKDQYLHGLNKIKELANPKDNRETLPTMDRIEMCRKMDFSWLRPLA